MLYRHRRPRSACINQWIEKQILKEMTPDAKNPHKKMKLAEVITKTHLYNFDPLKPHFYIVKLGFTGVYIIFLISAQKHRLWVLVRTASAVLTSTHNLCFEQIYVKYQRFYLKIFSFWRWKFLYIWIGVFSYRGVFVMVGFPWPY